MTDDSWKPRAADHMHLTFTQFVDKRQEAGLKFYGSDLLEGEGSARDALLEMYEELADAAVYKRLSRANYEKLQGVLSQGPCFEAHYRGELLRKIICEHVDIERYKK